MLRTMVGDQTVFFMTGRTTQVKYCVVGSQGNQTAFPRRQARHELLVRTIPLAWRSCCASSKHHVVVCMEGGGLI